MKISKRVPSVSLSEPKAYWVHIGRSDASTYNSAIGLIRSMSLGEMILVHDFSEIKCGFVTFNNQSSKLAANTGIFQSDRTGRISHGTGDSPYDSQPYQSNLTSI